MDKARLSNTMNLYSREEVLLLALCSVVRASSELAGRKNRTNPLFPQEEKLMYREEAWRGGRQRLQASTTAPAAF